MRQYWRMSLTGVLPRTTCADGAATWAGTADCLRAHPVRRRLQSPCHWWRHRRWQSRDPRCGGAGFVAKGWARGTRGPGTPAPECAAQLAATATWLCSQPGATLVNQQRGQFRVTHAGHAPVTQANNMAITTSTEHGRSPARQKQHTSDTDVTASGSNPSSRAQSPCLTKHVATLLYIRSDASAWCAGIALPPPHLPLLPSTVAATLSDTMSRTSRWTRTGWCRRACNATANATTKHTGSTPSTIHPPLSPGMVVAALVRIRAPPCRPAATAP